MVTETFRNLRRQIDELGPWFHNIQLQESLETAPHHLLGDYPKRKWLQIRPFLPADLRNWTILDIGCNAGFYSFELAKLGAKVVGIDSDEHYLRQALWLCPRLSLQSPPEFRKMEFHELASLREEFDLVLFMGIFYQLKYPLLALDSVAELAKRLFLFQSLSIEDEEIEEREVLRKPAWPKLSFIERSFSKDAESWWLPNGAAVEALLRSTGFKDFRRIAQQIYLCEVPQDGAHSRRWWDSWGRRDHRSAAVQIRSNDSINKGVFHGSRNHASRNSYGPEKI